jgi:hypothetical protein
MNINLHVFLVSLLPQLRFNTDLLTHSLRGLYSKGLTERGNLSA